MDCIFCKIISGSIPSTIIYQDDKVIAFNDMFPKAPEHKLIVPRKHIATLNDISDEDSELVSHMMFVARNLAGELKIAKSGYRVIINCNADGGQAVFHLHLHLMGGKPLSWPK